VLGVLGSNLIILVAATGLVVTVARWKTVSTEPDRHRRGAGDTVKRAGSLREIIVGFGGAAVILAALIVLRRIGVVDSPNGATRVGWLGIVVATEELVKYAMTGRFRPLRRGKASGRSDTARSAANRSTTGEHRPPRLLRLPPDAIHPQALLRGCGFALAENLLYLLLVPGRFLLRLVLAGFIHIGTTTLYAWPQSIHRSRAGVGIARLAVGVLIHLGYNIAIVSTATRLVIW